MSFPGVLRPTFVLYSLLVPGTHINIIITVAKLLYTHLRTVYHQGLVSRMYTIYHIKRVCCEGYLENDEEQCFRTFCCMNIYTVFNLSK